MDSPICPINKNKQLVDSRVGHRVLSRSECIVLLRSFKACNVLMRSFFDLLASYETQKNDAFFSVLFLRTQRTPHSFVKNVKERKESSVLL